MKTFNKVFTILVLVFLYIPMIVLAVASFNNGTDPAVWQGFTLTNYGELFRDGVLLPLLANSFIVAVISSLLATALGLRDDLIDVLRVDRLAGLGDGLRGGLVGVLGSHGSFLFSSWSGGCPSCKT